MKYQVVIATLALCFVITAAKVVVFKDCGSRVGTIISVNVNPCKEKLCILHAGKNVSVSIKFKSTITITSGTAVIHGMILGVPASFLMPDDDLCKFTSPGCPLAVRSEYTYTNQFFVQTIHPHIRLFVKLELIDTTTGADIACMVIPVSISS